jgi:hypothetical protein
MYHAEKSGINESPRRKGYAFSAFPASILQHLLETSLLLPKRLDEALADPSKPS